MTYVVHCISGAVYMAAFRWIPNFINSYKLIRKNQYLSLFGKGMSVSPHLTGIVCRMDLDNFLLLIIKQ